MNNYLSRAELDEISEGLIQVYVEKYRDKAVRKIDIEHFITKFLMLKIEYVTFAEEDSGKVGFLADGGTPLLICQNGKIAPYLFPKDTIVLDKFLLTEKEQSRRRFTMAHEAAHHILRKMNTVPNEACFHVEYDTERVYSKEEIARMFASVEWQADTLGASLLMPKFLVENALARFMQSKPIRVYGEATVAMPDKLTIRNMANYLDVSYTALFIRLRNLKMVEHHDISEYISKELQLGGVLQ